MRVPPGALDDLQKPGLSILLQYAENPDCCGQKY